MAFYTPPSLPRTPSAYAMHSSLPSLPTELLSSWSMQWRLPKSDHPLTPPESSTFERRKATTLPSIAHFDRQLSDRHFSVVHPLTPPDDMPPPNYSPQVNRLPPINDYAAKPPMHAEEAQASLFTDATAPVDWLDFSRTRSAHFIADKTCEMICYLWFATPPSPQSYPSPNNSPPFHNRPNSATTLQLVATPTFVSFMQKLLETTQVSQSVIVLSLHYIYRLKERNRFTPAQAGSEFRIAVAGLMMANKFLDDNTYTNKTWSEVSGIDLEEINRMEREFLMGVDFNLYVDKATYMSWLNLLKGLVSAKERDSRHFRKSRSSVRQARQTHAHLSPSNPRTYSSRYRAPTHRARSTSPSQTTRLPPIVTNQYSHAPAVAEYDSSPAPRQGSKRSAEAAFSPTSATFSHIPTKRPVSMSLQIPEPSGSLSSASSSSSYSPLEGLQSFSNMSIDSPLARDSSHSSLAPPSAHSHGISSTPASSWDPIKSNQFPETLVTAYAQDERRRAIVPQNLYFYTLACSPSEDEEAHSRKGRLRYHQPAPPSTNAPSYPPPQHFMPANIQSASTSPNDVHINVVPTSNTRVLPHFHETVWSRKVDHDAGLHHGNNGVAPSSTLVLPQIHPHSTVLPPVQPQRVQQPVDTSRHHYQQPAPSYHPQNPYPPPPQQQSQPHRHRHSLPPPQQSHAPPQCKFDAYEQDVYGESDDSPVQSATFANAGPPGVHKFHPTPVQSSAPLHHAQRSVTADWNRRY